MKCLLILCLLFVAGCGFTSWAKESSERAVTARPDTGEVPVSVIAKEVPTLVGNPTNVRSWWELVDTISYIVSGTTLAGLLGLGAKKTYTKIRDTVPVPQEEYKKLVKNGSK